MYRQQFGICNCFFTKNFFIKKYGIHVSYINDNQFIKEYYDVLRSRGCTEPKNVIKELQQEIERRHQLNDTKRERQKLVDQEYKFTHPQLLTLDTSFLDQRFLDLHKLAMDTEIRVDSLKKNMKMYRQSIYSFPVFTKEFCNMLVDELKLFEASPLPKGRPNTMNNYGINLDELGFDPFIEDLRRNYLLPLTKLLYPEWGGGELDSHKAFIVTYSEGRDVDLSYHYDNAEVTLNVSLNDNFEDGELVFGPMRYESSSEKQGLVHNVGSGVLHRSQQMHAAMPITEGERYNLIIWMRASSVRNLICPMCDEIPDIVPVNYGTGDGFTIKSVDVCSAS